MNIKVSGGKTNTNKKTKRWYEMEGQQIKKFYEKAFNRKATEDKTYYETWVYRFINPAKVWSYSDYERRAILKDMFPKTFGNLDKDANLNNEEFLGIDKFQRWTE